METSLPAVAPERKKGYGYDIYGFRVSGILRESSARLRAKLGPTVIGTAATVNKKMDPCSAEALWDQAQ